MKPVFCCLSITNKCMLKCKTCYIWEKALINPIFDGPSVDEWEKFISSLRRFIDGEFCINFVGGEPLMSDIVLELISYASSLGFNTLINTNAFLIDEKMAKRISNSGLTKISISLDSLKEDTHDFLRGVKGAYSRGMKAIEYLHAYSGNTLIHINTIIMEHNLDDIVDLAKWAIEDNRLDTIHFQAIIQPFSTEYDSKWYEKKEYGFLWPKDLIKVNCVLDELIKLKEENTHKLDNPISQFRIFKSYFENPERFVKRNGCHISDQTVIVDLYGQVYICFEKGAIGSIKDADFEVGKAWNSPKAELVRQHIKNCRSNCVAVVNCNYDESEAYIN